MTEPSTTPSGAPKTRLPISLVAVGVVALLILSLSLGGLTWWLLSRRPSSTVAMPALPVAAEAHFTPLPLEDVGGKALASYPAGKDWTSVPQGHQILDGVPFEVLTQLHLQGIVDATNNRLYPARFIGIPVHQRLARLHVYHGANLRDRIGRPIGALRLHYAGGTTHTLFVNYADHVRHWWREYGETDAVRDTNSVLVWSGNSPDSDKKNTTHRLYKSSFDLPSSAQLIESIDVFSLFGDSSYVLLAMTGETPGAEVKTNSAPSADDTPFRDDLVVKVSDTTGHPIEGAHVKGVALGTRTEDTPLGKMSDAFHGPGTVPVDFPARTRELLLIVSAPGFVSAEVNLNASNGKRFNREVSVKLEPGVRIGGFVRDTEGNPVAKAKVEIVRSTPDAAGHISIFKYGEATSNAQGKWTVREVPESLNNLLFRVTHTDFRRGDFEFSRDTGTGLLTRDALLASRAEFKLARR